MPTPSKPVTLLAGHSTIAIAELAGHAIREAIAATVAAGVPIVGTVDQEVVALPADDPRLDAFRNRGGSE